MPFTVDFALLCTTALTQSISFEESVGSLWETERHHAFLRLCLEATDQRQRQNWSEIRRQVEAGETTT